MSEKYIENKCTYVEIFPLSIVNHRELNMKFDKDIKMVEAINDFIDAHPFNKIIMDEIFKHIKELKENAFKKLSPKFDVSDESRHVLSLIVSTCQVIRVLVDSDCLPMNFNAFAMKLKTIMDFMFEPIQIRLIFSLGDVDEKEKEVQNVQ